MRSFSILATLLFLAQSALHGMPASIPENVPLDRLIRNLESAIEKEPANSYMVGQLGRLHLFAFARGVEDTEEVNPLWYGWGGIRSSSAQQQPPEEVRRHWNHLLESIALYQEAAKPDKNQALHYLGLGCAYETGSAYVGHVALPFDASTDVAETEQSLKRVWESNALTAYRQVVQLLPGPEPEKGSWDPNLREEATAGIVLLLGQRQKLSRSEKKELKRAKQELEDWAKVPRVVTPIVFSLDEARSLNELLDREKTVNFDLDGLGKKTEWPWVKRDTWLLVWDPEVKGEITSGRQLFGSVTWWMFWKNGYQALSALDDNQDGILGGPELIGLAAWQDRNSNGISDEGEVVPISALGIQQLDTEYLEGTDGTPWQPHGLHLRNGNRLPTYDWLVAPSPAE